MKKEKLAVDLLEKLVSLPDEMGVAIFLSHYFKNELPEFSKKTISFGQKRVDLLFQNDKKIKILFACHMDTVAPSSKDAFSLKLLGNKAFGLGTKDMKGGIVSTLLSLKEVDGKRGVGVLFYGDEETGFKGINAVSKNSAKLFGTIPKIIISPESRFNLGTGARGITVISIKVYGKRAHSARPQLGVDAIKSFYKVVEKIEKSLNSKKSPLGQTTLTIARITGGLLEPNGKIGSHAGTIPDYVEAEVSVRNSNPDKGGKEILKIIKKEGKRLNLKIEGVIKEDYPARITPKKVVNKLQKIIAKSNKKVEEGDPKLAGFNDVAMLAKKLGTYVVNLGPYGEGNHTKDEWVDVKSIVNTAKIFSLLINEYSK